MELSKDIERVRGDENNAHENSETENHFGSELGSAFVGVEEALYADTGTRSLLLWSGLRELNHTSNRAWAFF